MSESDHTLLLLAMSPPCSVSKSSLPLFHGDLVPLIDKEFAEYQGHTAIKAVYIS